MKDKIEKVVLLTTIIFPISMFIINKILGIFDWHLRSWIWRLVFLVIHIGGYIFSIFAISTMRSKAGKYIVILIWSFICLVICTINFIIFCFCVKLDTIKEINGKRYIGIKWDKIDFFEVTYYDKYNLFSYCNKNMVIEEIYENDRTYFDGKEPTSTSYYNKN